MRFGIRWLLTSVLAAIFIFNASISQAALDAPVDLTNPRIVPIYTANKGFPPTQRDEASYSGFLYSSRIIFTAAHSDYYFDNEGKIVNREAPEIYVGLPNSKVSEFQGMVRVTKRLVSKSYRFDGATLGDFAIFILERDLINAEPVSLLTEEIEKELINTRAEIRMHGYGEYKDRCLPGETAKPCTQKELRSNLPRSAKAFLRSLADAEAVVGYKRPQLAKHLIISNGKTGFGCSGDSGGSITTTYQGRLMYLGPTPNGMNAYSCGVSPDFDGIGGLLYSSPIYANLDILQEAEEFVRKQLTIEEKAAAEKAAAEKAAAEKAAAEKAAAEKAAAEKAAAEKAAAEKGAAEKAAAEKAALAQSQPKSSKTITCVKGKVIKKVTSANPTCPKGYKKK